MCNYDVYGCTLDTQFPASALRSHVLFDNFLIICSTQSIVRQKISLTYYLLDNYLLDQMFVELVIVELMFIFKGVEQISDKFEIAEQTSCRTYIRGTRAVEHLSIGHLSVGHLSVEHLSVEHLSVEHLSVKQTIVELNQSRQHDCLITGVNSVGHTANGLH